MSLKTGNAKKCHVWLYNKCHEINLSDPLGYFLFYVILTISYFRAWTIQVSSLFNDSMRPLIEIFSGILTAYFNCKWLFYRYVVVQIFFSFVSNSLSCYYHTLPYPKTEEKKIWTKEKIEPQHIFWGREATTGNTSVVRRLSHRKIYVRTSTRLSTASIKK